MIDQVLLTLLSLTVHLEFIAVAILGPLPQTKNGNQYVVSITDCYSKLTQILPFTMTWTSYIMTVLFDLSITLYQAPSLLVADNDPQFISELLENVAPTSVSCTGLQLRTMRRKMVKSIATTRLSPHNCIIIYWTVNKTGTSMSNHTLMRKIRKSIGQPGLLFSRLSRHANHHRYPPWRLWQSFTLTCTSTYRSVHYPSIYWLSCRI